MRARTDRPAAGRLVAAKGGPEMDAISLLTDDHRTVEALFQQFEGESDLVRRHDVGEQLISELTVHAEVEETWFYPEARRATPGAEQLTEEALHEHELVRQTIGQLETMQPEDAGYVPTMQRLKRMVQHHVQEEENELFPKVSAAIGKDRLGDIGGRIEQMKKLSAPRA
jgi:hemerythrin superfamily protein